MLGLLGVYWHFVWQSFHDSFVLYSGRPFLPEEKTLHNFFFFPLFLAASVRQDVFDLWSLIESQTRNSDSSQNSDLLFRRSDYLRILTYLRSLTPLQLDLIISKCRLINSDFIVVISRSQNLTSENSDSSQTFALWPQDSEWPVFWLIISEFWLLKSLPY